MKIVVYNSYFIFALSRAQVDLIKKILPPEYFTPIQEFHLLDKGDNIEMFEYDYKRKVVYFAYPVAQKDPKILEKAVEELLIGLARLKAKDKFFQPLKDKDRKEYLNFVDTWKSKCIEAINE